MSDIIKILFFKEEEDLACYLTAFYNVHVDEQLIEHAIVQNQYKWLNFVWVFKKNKLAVKDKDSKGDEFEFISFEKLFDSIVDVCKKDENRKPIQEMTKVCEWLIPFDEYKVMVDPDGEFETAAEQLEAIKMRDDSRKDNILQALLRF